MIDDLCRRLAQADAAAIVKLGRHLPRVRAMLARLGRLQRAIYVERASLPNGFACPLADLDCDHAAPYFSMALVPAYRHSR